MRRILMLVSLLFCLAACAVPALAQTPTAVEAHTNGSGQITIAWTAVAGATGYNVYFSPKSGTPINGTTPLTTTVYTVTGLTDTTPYNFVVTAIVNGTESNGTGTVARSGSAQAAAPTGLTAAASSGQVVLTWNAASNVYYDIYRQPLNPNNATSLYLGHLSLTASNGVVSYTDTAVTNGTAYTYAVAYLSGNGEGNVSGWVAATPLAPPSLTATVEATANQSGTEIDLGWTASAGAASYTLLRGTTSGGEAAVQTGLTGTSFADTGLSANTTYYYEITAVAGSSNATSSEAGAKTGSTLLAAPTLSGTAIDGQVPLTWTAVTGASYYDLYRVPNPGTDATGFYTRITSGTSYTDTNVTDGTAYTYKVAAGSSVGQGTFSNSLTLTPLAAPTLSATPLSTGPINLSWVTSLGATGYTVEKSTTGASGPWTVLASPAAQSGSPQTYQDTGVVSGTNYWYRVHATASGSDSGPGNTALAETMAGAPTGLTAVGKNGSVVLTWTAPSGDVGNYNVYKGLSAGNESLTVWAHGIVPTTWTDTSVTNGTRYFYKVAAVNEGGEGTHSIEAAATPYSTPPTVATAASASPNLVPGTTTTLTVLGASAGGEGVLSYAWSATGPGSVTYSANGTNAAKTTVATFVAAGSYTFTATITDSNASSVTSVVTVIVSQTGTKAIILPRAATVATGATQQFAVSLYDQFGSVISGGGAFTWSVTQGNGSVSAGGLFTAPGGAQRDVVQATSGDFSSTASVTVTGSVPSAPTGLTATPSDTQVSLSWTAPVGLVSSYSVYRGTSAGGEAGTPIATGITGTSYIDSGLTNGTTYYYEVTAVNATGEGAKSSEVSAVPLYGPPTVAAAASVSAPFGLKAGGEGGELSVLGASAGGEAGLTYTWSVALNGSGLRANISPNGTNAAKSATVLLYLAGVYTFTATITDAYGRSVTSSVNVTVIQTPTTVTVTPPTASVATGGTQQFSAEVDDQFGNAIGNPAVTWSVPTGSGTGTIDAGGLFTAPSTPEMDTVQAACGGVSGTASVTVTAPASGPYVVTAASASPNPVTGTTTTLSVVASDTLGNAPLTYTWAMTSGPAPVDYSDNADTTAQTTTVTFGQAGTYVFAVTITDSMGLSATSTVTVVVDQVASFVLLSPINVQLSDGATQQFTASDVDQFGNAMPTQPSSFTWGVTDGTGTVTQTGLYTAPHQTAYSVAVNETDVVQASDGSISGDAEVGVRGLPGLLLAPTPAPPTGLTATAGNKQITLTWNDSGASYNIYRSYSSGGEGPTPIANVGAGNGTTVTYTDTGLTNNQIYYYTVTAVVGGSESAFSGEASATPVNPLPTITVPVAASPTYVTGTTVVLSVTATDDTPGITYTWIPIGFAPVTFSDNGDTTASTTTATFTGAGTYTFTVYATDADDATVIRSVTVTVAQTLTAISVLTPSPPSPVTGGGTYFFQTGGTDQFGNSMGATGATYAVTSGGGSVSASTNPPGVLFHAPGNITSAETDTITMTDGSFTQTITVPVTPADTGGHWGTFQDAQQYQPVVTAKGTDAVTDPLGGGTGQDWWQPSGFEGVEYAGAGAISAEGCSVDVSGTFAYVFTWVPDTAASLPPGNCYLNVSAAAHALLGGNTFTVADGFGDPAEISNGNPASSGTHIVRVKASSGTATFTTPQIQSQASEPPSGGSVFCSVTVDAPIVPPPSVAVASPSDNAIVQAGTDVTVTVHADPNFLSDGDSTTALQSVTLVVTGGSGGGMMTAVANEPGTFTLDLGSPMTGVLTLTAQAQYGDGGSGGGTVEVDSTPSTFYVASFSAKAGSWTPNPNCVEEISSGQAQAAFDPGSIDGGGNGPFFVIYDWTTQNVYYSQDGTSGAFEPYGGNSIIEWQQGQANTTFKAQCFDVGFYILEAQCVATVYSQYSGSAVATFTQTCYIGGSAGDIDQSGGGTGHSQKAHQQTAHWLTAHAGGGGTGHQEASATVTFSPNSLIKLGLGAPKGNKTTITATVSPADQAGTVMFRSTNSDFITTNGEVTVQPSIPDASGKVTIYVTAASGTPGLPGNTGSPDCYIIASSGSPGTAPLATVPVLVLKPTGCSESPASSTQDSVTNKVWFPNQPPDPDWRLGTPPYGQAYFATLVRKDITITIYDQFNKPLDAMYDGRYVVNENITGGLTDPRSGPIQFTTGLLASGVIIDEVALPDVVSDDTDDPNLKSSQALWLNNQPTFPINPPHGALVYDNAFVADTPHYPKKRSGTGNQALSVYGYSLSPSWDRGITINPTESVNAIMTVTETPGK